MSSVSAPRYTVSAAPTVVIQPSRGFMDLDLESLYRSWELVYFLAWRDVKVRYKQTAIGVAGAVIQPLVTMLIFTLLFSRLSGMPSDGLPYPIFAFAALLPWTYFSQAIGRSGSSLVNNAALVTKVYFPRLAIPIAAVLAPIVDFVVTLAMLLVMMAHYRIAPGVAVLTLPLFLLMSLVTALAVSLWLSALCVKYRDVAVLIPFLLQIWLYISPIAYPAGVVPERWRVLYSLNPMSGVIDGFRWALLGTAMPDLGLLAVSSAVVAVVLVGGAIYFRQTELTFADVV